MIRGACFITLTNCMVGQLICLFLQIFFLNSVVLMTSWIVQCAMGAICVCVIHVHCSCELASRFPTLGALSNIHLAIFLVAGVPLSIFFLHKQYLLGVTSNVPNLSIILSYWSWVRNAMVIGEIRTSPESLGFQFFLTCSMLFSTLSITLLCI